MTRAAWVVLGSLALLLGIVGIFVPLLPTTPFLLLASACYLRGSKRLHAWLLSHGRLGQYIRDFEAGRGIPPRAKAVAITMLWASIAFTLVRVDLPWAQAGAVLVAIVVTVYLLRLPTWRGTGAALKGGE